MGNINLKPLLSIPIFIIGFLIGYFIFKNKKIGGVFGGIISGIILIPIFWACAYAYSNMQTESFGQQQGSVTIK